MPDRGSGSHCGSIRYKATKYLTLGGRSAMQESSFALPRTHQKVISSPVLFSRDDRHSTILSPEEAKSSHLSLTQLISCLAVLLLAQSIAGQAIYCGNGSDFAGGPIIPDENERWEIESVADSHPILDAQVFVELESESGKSLRAEATRALARNKLLYCCLLDFPEAGHWTMKVLVKRGSGRTALTHHLQIVEPQPTLLAYWKLLIFPPLLTFLFIANQFLRRSRA